MKGAFETFLVFLFGCTFVLLGFSMVEITLNYNRARLYQETIISLIERHNRYDNDVKGLIDKSNNKCSNCTYYVVSDLDKYIVNVDFNIYVSILNYSKKANIKAYTQSLK